jgi:hypothetical protein
MNCFLCSAAFLLLVSLAGCGSAKLFGAHPVPEFPGIADAPWPRLVDTPKAPAKGTYGAGVPDPAVGVAATVELGLAARDAAERAEVLAEPVLTEAERRRLTRHR